MKKIKKLREKVKRLRKTEKVKTTQVTFTAHEMFIAEANRQLSSKWTVQIRIYIRMHLPDGRVLIVDEVRNLPAKQIGRKEKKVQVAEINTNKNYE